MSSKLPKFIAGKTPKINQRVFDNLSIDTDGYRVIPNGYVVTAQDLGTYPLRIDQVNGDVPLLFSKSIQIPGKSILHKVEFLDKAKIGSATELKFITANKDIVISVGCSLDSSKIKETCTMESKSIVYSNNSFMGDFNGHSRIHFVGKNNIFLGNASFLSGLKIESELHFKSGHVVIGDDAIIKNSVFNCSSLSIGKHSLIDNCVIDSGRLKINANATITNQSIIINPLVISNAHINNGVILEHLGADISNSKLVDVNVPDNSSLNKVNVKTENNDLVAIGENCTLVGCTLEKAVVEDNCFIENSKVYNSTLHSLVLGEKRDTILENVIFNVTDNVVVIEDVKLKGLNVANTEVLVKNISSDIKSIPYPSRNNLVTIKSSNILGRDIYQSNGLVNFKDCTFEHLSTIELSMVEGVQLTGNNKDSSSDAKEKLEKMVATHQEILPVSTLFHGGVADIDSVNFEIENLQTNDQQLIPEPNTIESDQPHSNQPHNVLDDLGM